MVYKKSGSEGEFKFRGRAVNISDPDECERYCVALYEKIKWRPEGTEWHLFALDIDQAAYQVFENEQRKTEVWP